MFGSGNGVNWTPSSHGFPNFKASTAALNLDKNASLISSNATSIGSAASIGDGIFFVRGYFVNVAQETIVLDYYTNAPSYRVGLKVDETIVNAKEDDSLYDNAKGFTNYAAPGADRFKIGLSLTKKLLTDTNDTDFIEIFS